MNRIKITPQNIQQILAAAQQASKQIMSSYKRPLQVMQKADHTPVTNADMTSHKILAEALPQIIDIPLLSEEGETSLEEISQWEQFWVVDPLDGTKGFIQETDDFAINISIIHQNLPIFGMIYVPINDQAYYATKGEGAFKLYNKEWRSIQVNSLTESAATNKINVIGSRHSPSAKTETLCATINNYDYISMGSAIKFVILAEGGAHLYPRFAPSSWWDTAAGQSIVEEAGGAVLDTQLRPLRYELSDNLLNSNFIACAYQDKRWEEAWLKINRQLEEDN